MPHALETDRLLLRPFTPDDIDAAFDVLEGHPDVWKFDPGFQRTREQRAAIIRRYAETNEADGCGTLAVIERAGGQLIGYTGLQLYILPQEPFATPEVELYYKFGRDWWGQGFAREACRAMLAFAFGELRLARIVTVTDQHNSESIRLLQRLGMRVEPAPAAWVGSVIGILENQGRM